MGPLGTALTDYVGVGNVRRFQVRFAKQTWPAEKLETKIVVTGTREEAGEEYLVDLDVRLHKNADGEEKVVGQATAVLAQSFVIAFPAPPVSLEGQPRWLDTPQAPASNRGFDLPEAPGYRWKRCCWARPS